MITFGFEPIVFPDGVGTLEVSTAAAMPTPRTARTAKFILNYILRSSNR